MDPAPVTAIVAAYDRSAATRETIRRLQECVPPPAEIIVHFDNGAYFEVPPDIKVLRSGGNIGPGGGRNRMIREASHEWVASFDDDSYPVSKGFFSEVGKIIRQHPEVGVIAAAIRHRNPLHDSPSPAADSEVATFVGCGCVYRKSAFLATTGYVPLPVAYGIEEVDLALQLRHLNIPIIHCPGLEVFHDTHLAHHESARITAGAIQNQALLAWLRYPAASFPYGVLQWLNKIRDSLQRGRVVGTLRGILCTPSHLWRFRALRKPVSARALADWRNLR